MDTLSKRSNLLIILGVYPDDLQAPAKEQPPSTRRVYTEIPRVFTTPDAWLRTSNLRCWECDQFPSGYPRFIPLEFRRTHSGGVTCTPEGNFCEWNCAVRYATREYDSATRWDLLKAICIVESLFTGDPPREKIPPAPSKTLMKAYRGDSGITPQQWQEQLRQLNTNYALGRHRIDRMVV